jgi:hypothetical protein
MSDILFLFEEVKRKTPKLEREVEIDAPVETVWKVMTNGFKVE